MSTARSLIKSLLPVRVRHTIRTSWSKRNWALYRLGMRLGYSIVPQHFYSAEPNLHELAATKQLWARPLSMAGIRVDLSAQEESIRRICLPFQTEYRDNAAFLDASRRGMGPGFGFAEAQALHGVIRHYKPRRVVEVGSGVSTYCTAMATEMNRQETGDRCQITCIEPYPTDPLRHLVSSSDSIDLVVLPVQAASLQIFEELQRNDVLFLDSSHVLKAGSDTTHLLLEVLPRLQSGVLVHIHDIFFPYAYPCNLFNTYWHWNETAAVASFLNGNPGFEILFCMSHLHYERPDLMMELFPGYHPRPMPEGLCSTLDESVDHFAASLWLQRV